MVCPGMRVRHILSSPLCDTMFCWFEQSIVTCIDGGGGGDDDDDDDDDDDNDDDDDKS